MMTYEETEAFTKALEAAQDAAHRLIQSGVKDTDPRVTRLDAAANALDTLLNAEWHEGQQRYAARREQAWLDHHGLRLVDGS
jgi:hypothetical protein